MRRKDLAMTQEATFALVDAKEYAVICLTDPDGRAYGVPLDYVRQGESLFFHGAKEGRKIDSMRTNYWACAVIVGDTTIIPEKFRKKKEYASIEGPIDPKDNLEQKR